MKQTSSITRDMTNAQELKAAIRRGFGFGTATPSAAVPSMLYSLYVESATNLLDLASRYFPSATIVYTAGLWNGKPENSAVLEIVGVPSDLQSVLHLAGDIRQTNAQTSVLVTYASITAILVTESE